MFLTMIFDDELNDSDFGSKNTEFKVDLVIDGNQYYDIFENIVDDEEVHENPEHYY